MSSVESIGDFAVNLIEQELESPTPTSRTPFTGVEAEKGQSDIRDIDVSRGMLNQILNESFSVEIPEPDEEPQQQEEIPEIEISAPQEPHIIHEHSALVERFETAVRELTSVLREMTSSGFAGGGSRTTVGMIPPNFEEKPCAEKPRRSRKKRSRRDELLSLLGKRM